MKAVGGRMLKAQASDLLRAVEDGETVLITRRGRPIARLDAVEAQVRRPMRLRGIYAHLAPALGGLDLVEEIRQLRRESSSHVEAEDLEDSATTRR